MLNRICLFTLLSFAAVGQTGNGLIKGVVSDASGAIVSAAKITLVNSETNVRRAAVSSSAGIYYFGEMPPGPYILTVESAGFKKWVGTLQSQVGQTLEVNPTLEVGSLEAVVEVTGVTSSISTEGMQVLGLRGLVVQQGHWASVTSLVWRTIESMVSM